VDSVSAHEKNKKILRANKPLYKGLKIGHCTYPLDKETASLFVWLNSFSFATGGISALYKHLIHQRNPHRRNFLRRLFPGYFSLYLPIKSRLLTIPDNIFLTNSIGIPNVSLSSFFPRCKKQQSFVHKSLEGEDISGGFGPPSRVP
jgi:hypothetical protein